MGSLSIWHWLIVLFVIFPLYVLPIFLILRRCGMSMAWGILSLVPGLNFIPLWLIALRSWGAK